MHRLIAGTTMAALMVFQVSVASSTEGAGADEPIFARINDLVISQSDFETIFRAAVRHKYYHGRVPPEELEKFRRQVADDLVTQTLLYDEALAAGIKPDRKKIAQGIEAFDLKNASNPNWKARRERVIPRLVERLERQDLIEKIEANVRDLAQPDSAATRDYYLDHPDKFTEPERLGLALILLRVSPAASEETWREAEARLDRLRQRVEAGEEFAVLATQHSEHRSAADGGNLGYLHRGVLEDKVEAQLDHLGPGQTGTPIRLLEGVALFRLVSVQPARLRSFTEVHERARELLHRHLQDEAWNAYVNALRSSANVYIND